MPTREEATSAFGVNTTAWEGPQTNIQIRLTHRSALNPYAAKRLDAALTRVIGEHETGFGTLTDEVAPKRTRLSVIELFDHPAFDFQPLRF